MHIRLCLQHVNSLPYEHGVYPYKYLPVRVDQIDLFYINEMLMIVIVEVGSHYEVVINHETSSVVGCEVLHVLLRVHRRSEELLLGVLSQEIIPALVRASIVMKDDRLRA
jgi:hypothetical protein